MQQGSRRFAQTCKSRALNDGRLFIVRYRETSEARWPEFLKDSRGDALPGYLFYSQERGTSSAFPFGHPVPSDSEDDSRRNFYAAAQTLAEQMGNELKRLAAGAAAKASNGSAAQSTAPVAPSVILAVATEDVTPEQETLRAKLGEADSLSFRNRKRTRWRRCRSS